MNALLAATRRIRIWLIPAVVAITFLLGPCALALEFFDDAEGSPAKVKTKSKQGAAAPGKAGVKLTVAVLDFDANDPSNADLGQQIREIISAMLSGEPGFTLVDRTAMTRVLQEHELNLTGVVDTEQAIDIGKLVGARIMLTGRAFRLGKHMFITAKLIGTETSLVDGLVVKGKPGADVADLVMELSLKLAKRLRTAGPKLVAQNGAGADPMLKLKARFAKVKDLPLIAVIVTEQHMRRQPAQRVIDPAVETEIKLLLRQCGFRIQDTRHNELADWARGIADNEVSAWPRSLKDVDLVVTGEAFSEFSSRIGNLVCCAARAEINLIQRSDGKVALADRMTTRSVDLSEHIAGKTALQKAGRKIAINILQHLAQTLDPPPKKQASPSAQP